VKPVRPTRFLHMLQRLSFLAGVIDGESSPLADAFTRLEVELDVERSWFTASEGTTIGMLAASEASIASILSLSALTSVGTGTSHACGGVAASWPPWEIAATTCETVTCALAFAITDAGDGDEAAMLEFGRAVPVSWVLLMLSLKHFEQRPSVAAEP